MNELESYNQLQEFKRILQAIPAADKKLAFNRETAFLTKYELRDKLQLPTTKPFSYFVYLRELREAYNHAKHLNRPTNYKKCSFERGFQYAHKIAQRISRAIGLEVRLDTVDHKLGNHTYAISGATSRHKKIKLQLSECRLDINKLGLILHFTSTSERAVESLHAYYSNYSNDSAGLVISAKLVTSNVYGKVYSVKYLERETRNKCYGFIVNMDGASTVALYETKDAAVELFANATKYAFNQLVGDM